MKIRNVNGHAEHLHGIGLVKPGQTVDITKAHGDMVIAGRGWQVIEDDPIPTRKPAKPKKEAES